MISRLISSWLIPSCPVLAGLLAQGTFQAVCCSYSSLLRRPERSEADSAHGEPTLITPSTYTLSHRPSCLVNEMSGCQTSTAAYVISGAKASNLQYANSTTPTTSHTTTKWSHGDLLLRP